MKLLKNSLVYSVSILFQGGLTFLLLPFYTRYLSGGEYGIIAVLTSLTGFLSMFYLLSLHGSATRFYFDHKEDEEKTKELFTTIFIFIFAFGLILTLIFVCFHAILLDPILKGVPFYPYIFLSLIIIFLSSFYLLYQSILQAKQKALKYGVVNFLYVSINTILILISLIFFHAKVTGVLVAGILTNFIFFIYIFVDFFLKSKVTFNSKILKECLQYSLPLLPHTLFSWGMLMVNKILINNLESTASAGIYEISFIFANLINILAWGINQAYTPWFFEKMKDKLKNSEEIIKFAEDAVLFYCFAAFILSFFIQDVIKLFVTNAFVNAWLLIPFLAFAYVFNGLYYFFVNPIFYNKASTKYVSICTVVSAVINIGLNVLLLPKFGLIGSAIATLIAFIVVSILALIISTKIEKIDFRWKTMYAYTFFFLFISCLAFFANYFNWFTFLLIKLIIVIFVTFIVYLRKKTEIIWFMKSSLNKVKSFKNPNLNV